VCENAELRGREPGSLRKSPRTFLTGGGGDQKDLSSPAKIASGKDALSSAKLEKRSYYVCSNAA
jgi:hypothetical protein